MKKLTKEQVEQMFSDVDGFYIVYEEPKEKDSQHEDDGFIHITRKGFRIAFYNGQDDGGFTQSDVNRFANLVDERLGNKKLKTKKNKLTPQEEDEEKEIQELASELYGQFTSVYAHINDHISDPQFEDIARKLHELGYHTNMR